MAKKKAVPGKRAGAKRPRKPFEKKSTPTKAPAPSASARAFAEFLDEFGLNGPPPAPLVNIAFFLGAGFSKAWDPSYPSGADLFQLTRRERLQLINVEHAANFSGMEPLADLTLEHVRHLVYALNMNAKYPAIRSRYADDDSLRLAAEQLRSFFGMRLQRLTGTRWHWFDEDLQKFDGAGVFTPEQDCIRALFAEMFPLVDGSQGHLQGARFNFITTNYDWLPEVIVDSVCTDDDSAFLYLYRGITPESICGQLQADAAFAHSLVFNLLKLNGGMEIFRDKGVYHLDYRPRGADEYRVNSPVLMLPSREQNYQDDYFLAVFPKAVRLLQESTALVLVGYSLPEDDALLRFIIRHFCEDEADAHRKVLFYVDIAPEPQQMTRLQSVFPFAGKELTVYTYAGGFARWAAEVVPLI